MEFKEEDRPYSQNELARLRKDNMYSLKVGPTRIEHAKCSHFYLAKFRGRKEREAKEQNTADVGSCSVCWKLYKTHNKESQLVADYCHNFSLPPKKLTIELVKQEYDFYNWLYY